MLPALRKQTMSSMRNSKAIFRIIPSLICDNKPFSVRTCNFKHVPNFKRSLPEYKPCFGSKYSPPSAAEVANEKIRNYFSEKLPETIEEWDEAKTYFFNEIPYLSDVNYSSVVMNILLSINNVQLGQSFMKYLPERNFKPNVLAYLLYIALCGRNVHLCGQEEILRTLNKIQNYIDSSPVLDMKQGCYIIKGVCGTDKWRTAFEYLKKLPSDPNLEIRNILASAAIKNGDEALAWEIISKRFRKSETLYNYVVGDFLKYANNLLVNDKRKAETFLVKFFKHMECNNLVFNKHSFDFVEKFFQSHSSDWIINHTKVNRSGECDCCGKCLKPVEISDTEFSLLEKKFLEKSLKKRDVFINTTDKEFQKFITFIHQNKPFDIVIDGLNVVFTLSRKKNIKNFAIHLLQTVEKANSRSQRVLILGRKHMSEWPRNIMRKITEQSMVFLTNNTSQDDPFLCYAALASGSNTMIITNDLMRDHMFRLDDPHLIALFKKWQQSHQILLDVDDDDNIIFTEPIRHSISIQGSMDTHWHIPYDDYIERDPYEELNNWLCIRKPNT